MINIQETFVKKTEHYTLEIEYKFYSWSGDYIHPPESDFDILKVTLDNEDITSFYQDFIEGTDHWIDDEINNHIEKHY